ncbi:hypothetical protein KXR53_33705 [Inquilinus limosus]|uniref:hypothetical protein n=1 Tax=Inquilinus limosus TaxID=171674 RepID=UPI003F14E926
MDDHNGADQSDPANPSPVSTIIVRWWYESGSVDPEEKQRATRGTIRDLSGRTLGAFAGFDALVRLLRRIFAERRRPPADTD